MKKFFAGGNTAYGFCGYFDKIRRYDISGMSFIIKGGAGTGKSTLMKKVAEYLEKNGEDVERFYCSGDIQSLDAVYAPKLNVVIQDGTSPHATEPKVLGEDIYVNVAAAVNEEKIAPHYNEIRSILANKAKHYENCYAYLYAAGKIAEVNFKSAKRNLKSEAERITEIIKKSCAPLNYGVAEKKAFLSAITAEGEISFINESFSDFKKITVKGVDRYSSLAIVDEIFENLKNEKIECLGFRDALLPNAIQTIVFVQAKTLVTVLDCESDQLVLSECDVNSPYGVMNESEVKDLIDVAADCLYEVKREHKKTEAYYIASMRWDMVDAAYEQIINRI